MKITDGTDRGPLLTTVLGEEDNEIGNLQWLIHDPDSNSEVYYRVGGLMLKEPAYYLVTNFSKDSPLLAEIAPTGEPLRIQIRDNYSDSLETVVERDPRGSYHIHRRTFHLVDRIREKGSDPEKILKFLLHHVYNESKKIRLPNRNEIGTELHRAFSVFNYSKLKEIYKHIHKVQGDIDIVPDQSPTMALVRLSIGCNKGCIFCPYGDKPFKVSSRKEFTKNLKEERRWLESMYGKRINEIDEAFPLSSDLGRVELAYRAGKTDLSAIEAGKLVRRYMPNATKISAFVDSKTALRISEEPHYNPECKYNLNGKSYSTKFFENLLNKAGISRLVVGWETGKNEGTYALYKYESYNEKLLAARLIQDSGILLKAVIQLGAWGGGFYDENNRFHGWRSITKSSARLANEVQPYRLYLSDAFIHNGSSFESRFKIGPFFPYNDFREGIAKELALLEKELKIDYNRRNPMQIELHYERFIPHQKRSFIVVH